MALRNEGMLEIESGSTSAQPVKKLLKETQLS
jgi:hypothetical protein